MDGETQTGWFAGNFTLAEIKTLGVIATDSERPQQQNGLYKIVTTFQEIIDLAKAQSAATGRAIALYPETKNPTYHRDLGLPLEDKLIELLTRAGLNSKTAQVYVQSFEPSRLKYMRSKGLNTRLIQLIDAADVDLKSGDLILTSPFDKPYDWAKAGDTRLFSDMVSAFHDGRTGIHHSGHLRCPDAQRGWGGPAPLQECLRRTVQCPRRPGGRRRAGRLQGRATP